MISCKVTDGPIAIRTPLDDIFLLDAGFLMPLRWAFLVWLWAVWLSGGVKIVRTLESVVSHFLDLAMVDRGPFALRTSAHSDVGGDDVGVWLCKTIQLTATAHQNTVSACQ